MPEFDSCVAGGELPVGLPIVGAGAVSPSLEFCAEHVVIGLCHHQSLGERRHPCSHESVEPVRLLPHRAVAAALKYVQIRVRQA